ncbi:MAG: 4-phosphoerythronate dehydrogenase [Bacteroidales bacterium]
MKIVADDKVPFLNGVFEPCGQVDYIPGRLITSKSLKDADVLITRSITLCNSDLLKGTHVKFIATATIGDDHIDKIYCKEHGIRWFSAKGCNAGAVEQYVMAALIRYLSVSDFNPAAQTIGIVGVGTIGRKVQKAAETLGMKVLLNDPPRQRAEGSDGFVSMEQIQQQADIITIHVPLHFGGSDKTFHMLDDTFFEGLTRPVVLINTARGAVIETDVLKRAKSAGLIRYLVLDVWEHEPELDQELLELTDIATPHIAGYSIEGKANATGMVVDAVADFLGLKLKQWRPQLPPDPSPLTLDCKGLNGVEVMDKIFETVFPIGEVSHELKLGEILFEEMRRDYQLRRENQVYVLKLENCDAMVRGMVRGLGFRLGDGR